jgi:hypothetical protein
MKQEKALALEFIEKIRRECRISHASGVALTGAEMDSFREALLVIGKPEPDPPETPPKEN